MGSGRIGVQIASYFPKDGNNMFRLKAFITPPIPPLPFAYFIIARKI